MSQAERISRLKELLLEKKTASIKDLSTLMQVTPVTLRKDLLVLENEGFLNKTHGAVTLDSSNHKILDKYAIKNYEKKKTIGKIASSFIDKDDSIFISSGSTCYVFASLIDHIEEISVVTNNVNIATDLIPPTSNNLLVGGEISSVGDMRYTSGATALRSLEHISVSKAFLSIDGIDLSAGFTSNYFGNVIIFQRIPIIAKEIFILQDSYKFGRIGIHSIFQSDAISCVITDSLKDEQYIDFFKKNNIRFIYE